jgi:predicted DNA-binding transcriptional regulator YafY
MDRQSVELQYRGFARQEETRRTVDPYALAFRWGLWYLVAFCHLRQALRTFRVDRIMALDRRPGTFIMPDDFSVRDYLGEAMRLEPTFSVLVELDASVAPQAREWHSHWMEITDHDDGSITVRFDAADLDWATRWTLQQGPGARVLSPPELAERVQMAARGILEQYGGMGHSATYPDPQAPP